jgi:hypothetical protein
MSPYVTRPLPQPWVAGGTAEAVRRLLSVELAMGAVSLVCWPGHRVRHLVSGACEGSSRDW